MTDNIYTYLENKFNIKVSDYKFKKDYIQNPLKLINARLREKPYKEDLEYIYQKLDLSLMDICEVLKIPKTSLVRWLNKFNIKKLRQDINGNMIVRGEFPKEEALYEDVVINRLSQNDLVLKYGLKSPSNIKIWKRKYKIPSVISKKIDKITYYDIIKKYNIDENRIHYGLKNPITTKYNYWESDIKYLYLEKNMLIDDLVTFIGIDRHTIEKYNRKYGIRKDTNLITYHIKKSCYKKYEKESYFGSAQHYKDMDKIILKTNESMKRNHSYGKSKEEDDIYMKLLSKYNVVERQYYSEKYPFKCDFYIPKIDTYIEYQGFWMHGFEPYIGTPEQQEKVRQLNKKAVENIVKNKRKKQYEQSIYIWTESDVLKRATAKNNGLNYLEFFNMKQFDEWFNKQ